MKRLDSSFFSDHAVDVAFRLIGKTLVFGSHRGLIVETEAYRGADDPASHAFKGSTPRSKIMFGPPGKSYVYLIYGVYYCLNITTEEEGSPSAVLIRGLHLLTTPFGLLKGPGKLCRHLQITTAHNGLDLISSADFYLTDEGKFSLQDIESTPRIGIKSGQEKLWRFVAKAEILGADGYKNQVL